MGIWWKKLVDLSNEIVKVAAAWGFLLGIGMFIFADEIRQGKTLLKLPEIVAEQQVQIDALIRPLLIEFTGNAFVEKPSLRAGESQSYLFFLRQEASCETIVVQEYYNLERNIRVPGNTVVAQQAPVTESMIPFPIDIPLPNNIEPGTYVYWPLLVPKNCGVYKEFRAPPSQPFEVVE